jgi:hypothetical protein
MALSSSPEIPSASPKTGIVATLKKHWYIVVLLVLVFLYWRNKQQKSKEQK